jgi:hypothetical protein
LRFLSQPQRSQPTEIPKTDLGRSITDDRMDGEVFDFAVERGWARSRSEFGRVSKEDRRSGPSWTGGPKVLGPAGRSTFY